VGEHAHHVLTNELAAAALPSRRFGANAAWFRLNALLYNLLSTFERVALPEELPHARPKRLRLGAAERRRQGGPPRASARLRTRLAAATYPAR